MKGKNSGKTSTWQFQLKSNPVGRLSLINMAEQEHLTDDKLSRPSRARSIVGTIKGSDKR